MWTPNNTTILRNRRMGELVVKEFSSRHPKKKTYSQKQQPGDVFIYWKQKYVFKTEIYGCRHGHNRLDFRRKMARWWTAMWP